MCETAKLCQADCRFLQQYDSCLDFCLDLLEDDRLEACRQYDDCRQFNFCFCNAKQVNDEVPEACNCTIAGDAESAVLTGALLGVGFAALLLGQRRKRD
ncbi:MAG: hypothetical protein GX444_20110 [Myxococcales bacterium]|nr:hypothetical protein [Myxococcales bacterium]